LLGARSPVQTVSDTIFAEVSLDGGAVMPLDADYEERAVYIVSGQIDIQGDMFDAGRLLIFRPGDRITLKAASDAQIVIVGGAALDGPRHVWWNFVSSRKERIEEAKEDWKAAAGR
jgi:redox-sensitive bicupin YhaK (pirin superfamily)